MNFTRRDMGKLALAALPAARLLAKPNSKWGGVQIGLNVPYSLHGLPGSADDILRDMIQLNLSAAELRLQPVEAFLGSPAANAPARTGRGPLTPEQEAARKAATEELRKWRLGLSMDGFKQFRKKYEDAGVLIEIVKFDNIDRFTDEEVDYCFQLSKVLGAKAISCEIPLSQTKRLGAFAEKHKMMVGYHGHTNITSPEAFGKPESWETAFTYSKYNGANIDLGHFIAANNVSPAAFLEKHLERITHVHIKDRKLNNGPNTPFGQGDTPIKDILQMMSKRKWTFQGTIEFEYRVPEGSDVMTEIAKCVAYCKEALS
ncbi:MAG: TIM barrel protein [Bryobacteraceae bacterium]|jgi:sugar phosphate isomerase/epimerase